MVNVSAANYYKTRMCIWIVDSERLAQDGVSTYVLQSRFTVLRPKGWCVVPVHGATESPNWNRISRGYIIITILYYDNIM